LATILLIDSLMDINNGPDTTFHPKAVFILQIHLVPIFHLEPWSPTGRPVAPLSFAELLRNPRDLVVRHPALNPDRKIAGLKP